MGTLGGRRARVGSARAVHGERVGRDQKNPLFSDICASSLGWTRRAFGTGSVLKPLGRVPIEARQALGRLALRLADSRLCCRAKQRLPQA